MSRQCHVWFDHYMRHRTIKVTGGLMLALCAALHAQTQDPRMRQPTRIALDQAFEGKLGALDRASTWLNTQPLGVADLRGQVVLVNFWTYTCINWRRTLPHLRAWADKYRDSGLIVVGVHTPEFRFETDINNIRRAVREQDIGYPIVVDSHYSIWDEFRNQFWPAVYLFDANGRVRHHKFGEGDYEQIEFVIQRLLIEAGHRSFDSKPVSVRGLGAEAAADWRNLGSPETYLGSSHASSFASVREVQPDRSRAYAFPSRLKLNEWSLAGRWSVNPDSTTSISAHGRIAFRFHARDLHLVMGSQTDNAVIPFRVTIDGKPPGPARGIDIDADGRGTLDGQRMFQLIRQAGPIEDRRFEIEFFEPGAEVFVFTFG
jgi:thiol-disulfide isomerase/thioredoxin